MRFLRSALLIPLGLTIAFLLAEGLCRLYLAIVPAPPDSPYLADRQAIYRLRPTPAAEIEDPDDVINSLGFRDREHATERVPGTARIMGLGDSFVYGRVSLSDNFLRVTESRINSKSDANPPVEMYLMGIGGYSTENELGVLREFGPQLQPDLVVLNFFVGNDILGIPVRGEVLRGRLYYVGSPHTILNVLRKSRVFVVSESFFLTNIKRRLLRRRIPMANVGTESREVAGARPDPAGTDTSSAAVTPDVASSSGKQDAGPAARPPSREYLYIQEKRFPIYLRKQRGKETRWWRKAEQYLAGVDDWCAEHHVPWVLVIIPTEVQVDAQVRRQVLDGLNLSADDFDFERPQRRLRDFASARGIECLDLLPLMRERHRTEGRLYVPNDTHWNDRGNHIAGEALAGFITDRGLLTGKESGGVRAEETSGTQHATMPAGR
ncbi:MAG: hypothetical protein KC729_04830 [Candidatus Eisenbacteria bacterium]|uniref:AlgX/AlgJ SGNH hydrolase-like domain-containing protein n=1 Tax=Eiseniibacteriota bacterium TaxID=2212470 RepID=A0A956RN01_UNCEI|nr:hypothetical protein [Candidatus Eisenbacteria bacterium]